MLKFLDKFFNRDDLPWVRLIWDSYYPNSVPHASPICGSFWWKQICKLMPIFRGISSPLVGDGKNISMWHDKWHEILLADRFACLFSFVINEDCSVAEFYATNDWSDMFHISLSPEAFEELQSVLTFKSESLNHSDAVDSWTYVWGQAYFPKNII